MSKILPFPLIVAWVAAVLLAIVAAGMTQLYFGARQENTVVAEQERVAELELQSLQTRVETERLVNERKLEEAERSGELAQARVATLSSVRADAASAVGAVVWNPARQEGVLAVSKLPPPVPARDYELWLFPTGAKPMAAGVVPMTGPGRGRLVFHLDNPPAAIAKFAITLERKGAAHAVPTGPTVLVSPETKG